MCLNSQCSEKSRYLWQLYWDPLSDITTLGIPCLAEMDLLCLATVVLDVSGSRLPYLWKASVVIHFKEVVLPIHLKEISSNLVPGRWCGGKGCRGSLCYSFLALRQVSQWDQVSHPCRHPWPIQHLTSTCFASLGTEVSFMYSGFHLLPYRSWHYYSVASKYKSFCFHYLIQVRQVRFHYVRYCFLVAEEVALDEVLQLLEFSSISCFAFKFRVFYFRYWQTCKDWVNMKADVFFRNFRFRLCCSKGSAEGVSS